MSEFYKDGGEYCRECVGRKGDHTEACAVPAKEAALAQQALDDSPAEVNPPEENEADE